MSQQPTPNYAPAPEGGTKFLLLAISFFIPIVGIIIGIIYLQRPDPESQDFGRQALIAAVAFFVLFCLCFACYFIFVFGLSFLPLLLIPFTETGMGSLLPLLSLI